MQEIKLKIYFRKNRRWDFSKEQQHTSTTTVRYASGENTAKLCAKIQNTVHLSCTYYPFKNKND